jgi:hypothetical protein
MIATETFRIITAKAFAFRMKATTARLSASGSFLKRLSAKNPFQKTPNLIASMEGITI